ncbi:MAG: trypsin-like peptidase domain-containing protein [Proteobacteria bacterium]|nr:trypsin-like peptidase domain-containing protein [Pseudomonadota bacterium]
MTAHYLRLVLCLLACVPWSLTQAATKPAENPEAITHEAESAVVKVFSSIRRPDVAKPWAKSSPIEATGSGVIIEGHRILTNAHVVGYASQVQVQGNQSGDKVSATVEAFAPGIDLAVLKLDDDSFFNGRPALPRATALPQVKDPVLAYGFPTGGTSLSITRGIVSRIEFVQYGFLTSGLRIQIDAAINPGNSGGPAIASGKMIGLAFSHLQGSENISYIIPNEEIELFLKDIADGHYDGKPGMYDTYQTLENPALRGYLKLDPAVKGMIVTRPDEGVKGNPLKAWDVITRIGDVPVDDDGMVKVNNNLRVNFQYVVQRQARDGMIPVSVVRGGKPLALNMPVPSHRPLLIESLQGEYPSYFIYGPIVFSRASLESLALLRGRAAFSPAIAHLGDPPSEDRQELVVISSPLFPHALSKGYSNPSGEIVDAVNGVKVKSLAQLVAYLRDLKDEYVVLDFDDRYSEGLVFPRAKLVAATEDILTDNGVRTQGSADMLRIWQASK